jgi:hypothetical protein
MVIDVVVFTPSAPILHIQGHSLHIYIMDDATVPLFGPIPLIGCQGTQKVTGSTTTRHNNGDGRHDVGDGQQGDSRHNNGNGQHDNDDGRHEDDRRHEDDDTARRRRRASQRRRRTAR